MEINNSIFSTRVNYVDLELQSSKELFAEDTEEGLCVCTK